MKLTSILSLLTLVVLSSVAFAEEQGAMLLNNGAWKVALQAEVLEQRPSFRSTKTNTDTNTKARGTPQKNLPSPPNKDSLGKRGYSSNPH
jgi:hypothetical protein